MKKYLNTGLSALFVFSLLLLPFSQVLAVYVNGYYRSNGTYVHGYERTAPDGNPYNNYSYPGNYNPNTGEITGGNPDTYLNNYYNKTSGGYSSGYTYPTTPTCPINSYYDGVSSCTCNYGYVSNGGSCISQDSMCQNQVGYNSTYNSLDNTCQCNYGYVLNSSGQCTNANLVCSSQIGIMSQYNNSTKRCECMAGYQYDGSSCVYKTSSYSNTSSYSANTYASTSNCPLNSHTSSTDSTQCQCDSGYQTNSIKTACIPVPVKTNDQACQDTYGIDSNWDGTKTSAGLLNCGCQAGYGWNVTKTKCIITTTQNNPTITSNTSTQNTDASCKTSYGQGSELEGNLCYCSKNFKWNTTINSCIAGNPIFTKSLTTGSIGGEVVALKNFLAMKKLYTGYVNTPYDINTQTSVMVFQALNNISPTGTVGPKTRSAINGMIKNGY